MKVLKRILYLLLLLLFLISGGMLISIFSPDTAEKLVGFLQPGTQTAEQGAVPVVDRVTIETPENAAWPEAVTEQNKEQNDVLGGQNGMAGGDVTNAPSGADRDGLAGGEAANGTAERKETYIKPDTADVRVPEQVAGRNGLKPVEEEKEQVGDKEADRLEKQLGTGETGDGLTFDPVFYPYYQMLDETGKHLYRQIYANAQALNLAFAPVEAVNTNTVRNAFEAVCNDHPELFFLETAYGCKYMRNGQCVEIDLKTNRTADNLEKSRAAFLGQAQEILAGAQGLADPFAQEQYVHDALIARTEYDLSAPMNQSAYSALVNGRTVCAGYARAFQYLLQQLGIPCYYCTGYAGQNHAWNIVGFEDGYYNVDTTWDDTGEGSYDYFNKTDADYADTHVREDLSVNLPPCDGQKYRMAGQEAGEAGRSLEELGIAPESALNTLEAYYADCREQMEQRGKGNYTFYNVVSGDALLEEIYAAYQSDAYRSGYLDETMTEIGAWRGTMSLEIETLQDGYYRIAHEISLR